MVTDGDDPSVWCSVSSVSWSWWWWFSSALIRKHQIKIYFQHLPGPDHPILKYQSQSHHYYWNSTGRGLPSSTPRHRLPLGIMRLSLKQSKQSFRSMISASDSRRNGHQHTSMDTLKILLQISLKNHTLRLEVSDSLNQITRLLTFSYFGYIDRYIFSNFWSLYLFWCSNNNFLLFLPSFLSLCYSLRCGRWLFWTFGYPLITLWEGITTDWWLFCCGCWCRTVWFRSTTQVLQGNLEESWDRYHGS